jgi:hypothetical protein
VGANHVAGIENNPFGRKIPGVAVYVRKLADSELTSLAEKRLKRSGPDRAACPQHRARVILQVSDTLPCCVTLEVVKIHSLWQMSLLLKIISRF